MKNTDRIRSLSDLRYNVRRLIIDLMTESIHDLQEKTNYGFIVFKKENFIKLSDTLSIIGVRVRYGNIEFAVVLNDDAEKYGQPEKLHNGSLWETYYRTDFDDWDKLCNILDEYSRKYNV